MHNNVAGQVLNLIIIRTKLCGTRIVKQVILTREIL